MLSWLVRAQRTCNLASRLLDYELLATLTLLHTAYSHLQPAHCVAWFGVSAGPPRHEKNPNHRVHPLRCCRCWHLDMWAGGVVGDMPSGNKKAQPLLGTVGGPR